MDITYVERTPFRIRVRVYVSVDDPYLLRLDATPPDDPDCFLDLREWEDGVETYLSLEGFPSRTYDVEYALDPGGPFRVYAGERVPLTPYLRDAATGDIIMPVCFLPREWHGRRVRRTVHLPAEGVTGGLSF